MVYSTCSLSRFQNEEVVEAFLREQPEALLDKAKDTHPGMPCRIGVGKGVAAMCSIR